MIIVLGGNTVIFSIIAVRFRVWAQNKSHESGMAPEPALGESCPCEL